MPVQKSLPGAVFIISQYTDWAPYTFGRTKRIILRGDIDVILPEPWDERIHRYYYIIDFQKYDFEGSL